MQHTHSIFNKGSEQDRGINKRRGREREREGAEEPGEGEKWGERRRAESVALISWQFGTGPDSPGKATDVSEPVRHARREDTHTHVTHPAQSHIWAHTAQGTENNTENTPCALRCTKSLCASMCGSQRRLSERASEERDDANAPDAFLRKTSRFSLKAESKIGTITCT